MLCNLYLPLGTLGNSYSSPLVGLYVTDMQTLEVNTIVYMGKKQVGNRANMSVSATTLPESL